MTDLSVDGLEEVVQGLLSFRLFCVELFLHLLLHLYVHHRIATRTKKKKKVKDKTVHGPQTTLKSKAILHSSASFRTACMLKKRLRLLLRQAFSNIGGQEKLTQFVRKHEDLSFRPRQILRSLKVRFQQCSQSSFFTMSPMRLVAIKIMAGDKRTSSEEAHKTAHKESSNQRKGQHGRQRTSRTNETTTNSTIRQPNTTHILTLPRVGYTTAWGKLQEISRHHRMEI